MYVSYVHHHSWKLDSLLLLPTFSSHSIMCVNNEHHSTFLGLLMKKDVLLVSVERSEPVEVVRSLYQLMPRSAKSMSPFSFVKIHSLCLVHLMM